MREKFAHWNVLFMQYLKRDWKLLIVWVLGLGGFSGGFVPLFVEMSKEQGLAGMYEIMQNPAMTAMIGPMAVKEMSDYTIGAMYSNMMLLFCGLFAMILAAMHIVMHTRREEELGLTEFVCAYRVGRQANSLALLVEMILVQAVLALFTGGLMLAFGEESIAGGAVFLFGASIGVAGMLGTVFALLMAQLMPTATSTLGMTMGLIGLLYLLRAGTDISNVELSMLNPMGWTYLTYPFAENRVFPLVIGGVFCLILASVSMMLEGARDMGSGYFPELTGKGRVSRGLLSVPGLLVRLNRGAIIGWLAAFICLGGAYGSIYGEMEVFLESNEMIKAMFTVDGMAPEASFTSVILIVMAGLSAILPIAVMNKLTSEEMAARMSQVFATKVSRAKLYWGTAAIAAVSAVLALLASAGSLGGVAISAMKDSTIRMEDYLAAGMNYLPVVLLMMALAAAAAGWLPGRGKLAYVYLVYALMISYLQGMLKFPEAMQKTSALDWLPRMPVEEFDGAAFGGILALCAVLLVIGYVGYRRRDLVETA